MTQQGPQTVASPPAEGTNFPAVIFSVLTDKGELWQLGQSVPGSDEKNPLAIVGIYPAENGGVDFFVLPKPESDMHKNQQAAIMNLAPQAIYQTMTIAGGDVWHRMRQSTKEVAVDAWVAGIASKWTGIPQDLLEEHLAEARLDMEEGQEPEEPEELETNNTTPAPALPAPNGVSGSPS